MARKPVFHRPELDKTREDLERQTAPDFFEVRASGRVSTRGHVIHVLQEPYAKQDDDRGRPPASTAVAWARTPTS